MTRTAIIAAMPGELKPFVCNWSHHRFNGVDLWRWPHDGDEWIAACAGAGQSAATRAFAEIEKSGPVHIAISTGWAGALNDQLQCGRAYCVSTVVDARTGERFTTALNGEGDAALKGHDFSRAESIPTKSSGALAPHPLTLVTSPRVANAPEKQRLAATYSADLVDMEAAAIARLAQMRGIPFYCVKGISDGYSDQLPDFNNFILSDGRFRLARFVVFAILRPWHWRALIGMGQNSKNAAQQIAELLLNTLHQ